MARVIVSKLKLRPGKKCAFDWLFSNGSNSRATVMARLRYFPGARRFEAHFEVRHDPAGSGWYGANAWTRAGHASEDQVAELRSKLPPAEVARCTLASLNLGGR